MKTAISYYGGKLSLLKYILPLIPSHTMYIEPFMGGGAVFFAKEPAPASVINDTNYLVINFYNVLKNNFDDLKNKVDTTLYSRATYTVAKAMYNHPTFFTDLQLAWAFWVLTNQGFSGMVGSWSYGRTGQKTKTFNNKKLAFTKDLATRLENTQIECADALAIIKSRDSKEAFFFVDPPYLSGANQGHYKDYTEHNFERLLKTLSTIKGTFLLTTYDHPLLEKYVQKYGWHQQRLDRPLTASNARTPKRKRKTEVFTANYTINEMNTNN